VLQAIEGLSTIWLVIGAGWVLAHFRVFDDAARRLLARAAFTVAMPALLVQMMAHADLGRLFSRALAASMLAIVVAIVAYVLVATVVLHRPLGHQVIGALSSSYTNVANIGLPIATYVLGDATWVAPILLVQVGILQPAALMILDASDNTGRVPVGRYLVMPFRNPITVAVVVGVLLRVTGLQLPEVVGSALDSVGQMAVPLMLIAFGVSLRVDPLPGKGSPVAELWLVQAIKLLLQPMVAYLAATLIFHLDAHSVLAVTLLAALPTATVVHIIATRYRSAEQLARDAVLWSTILTVPIVIAVSGLLR
jgi:malonate transporter and related proteins